ncbi:MAG: diacylglycerol/lipid kinase family protein [Pyrinomonadaceae bacterium]
MSERTKIYLRQNNNLKLPLVIVNPHSAGGNTKARWYGIASDLRAHFGPFQVAFTKRAGDGIELAKNAANSGRSFVIACGGDGTVNEVLNGIMLAENADTELGVIPSGTGGDFRRTIGMPTESREAARALREGTTTEIDVGKVEFATKHSTIETRYFVNVSSFGLSAEINLRVSANSFFKWLPLGSTIRGKAKFAFSTIQEVIDINPVLVQLKVDGDEWKSLETLNFCVCNSRFFGGGMKIAPDAKITDGEFDIVNIGDINTARIFSNGYKLYNGTHLNLPEVKSLLAKTLEIKPFETDAKIRIEMDGEVPGYLPAKYEILPKALKLRIPKRVNKR